MKLTDIREVDDLKQMNVNDVVDVLDELRGIASKRGMDMLQRGRVQARRAIGAPDPGQVTIAFLGGLLLGAAIAAIATMLASPVPPAEARRKLNEQVEKARGRVGMRGDGQVHQEETAMADEMGSHSGSLRQPSA